MTCSPLRCSRIQVGTGWVSHVHEQGKEAAAARGEAPLQEVPHCHRPPTHLPTIGNLLLGMYGYSHDPGYVCIYFLTTTTSYCFEGTAQCGRCRDCGVG